MMARQFRIGDRVDNDWEALRFNAIGSVWGRDTSAAVQIVGVAPWVLRGEVSR